MKTIKQFFIKNGTKFANICFVLIFVLFFVLLVLNEYNIQFLYNGFHKLTDAKLQVYFLDVGQASSTLVILPTGKTLLVDTGSGDSEKDFLESVDKILSENKLKEIDMLVLTHSDEDHVGGAVSLLAKYQVNAVYRPKLISTSPLDVPPADMKVVDSWIYEEVLTAVYQEPNCEVEFLEDEIIVENDCQIEIFACKEKSYGQNDTNSFSPFITITYNSKTFMLCGDATQKREKELVDSLKAENRTLSVDFLLVAHHGSRASSTEEFLSFVSPRYAIISAGDELHPAQDVLDRLASCHVEGIFCTKTDGMIGIAVYESGAFKIVTMSKFLDLPLICCIIFIVIALWQNYFVMFKQKRKFSY